MEWQLSAEGLGVLERPEEGREGTRGSTGDDVPKRPRLPRLRLLWREIGRLLSGPDGGRLLLKVPPLPGGRSSPNPSDRTRKVGGRGC